MKLPSPTAQEDINGGGMNIPSPIHKFADIRRAVY